MNAVDVQTLQNNNNLESVKTNGIVMNGMNNNTDDCSITDSGAAMEEDNSSGIATTASSSQHENDMQVGVYCNVYIFFFLECKPVS